MSGLYVLGILTGILIAFLYKGTLFRGEPVPFVMELPNYRMPGAKNVAQLLWEKAKDFLQKAFSVILIATIVVWFLQSFDLHLNMVEDSAKSILAAVSGFFSTGFPAVGVGRLADLYLFNQWFYGKGKRGVYVGSFVRRRDCFCIITACSSLFAGIQLIIYTVCGCDCFCKKRTGRKVGSRVSSLAMVLLHGLRHFSYRELA